jgi:hypothetical protein
MTFMDRWSNLGDALASQSSKEQIRQPSNGFNASGSVRNKKPEDMLVDSLPLCPEISKPLLRGPVPSAKKTTLDG